MTSHALQTRRSLLKASAALAFTPAAFWMKAAHAQAYPSGPVSMMVPYPAGGPSDLSARILSGPIGDSLGAKVVVENLGGATGTIAASKVLNAKADGGVFFQGTQNELILPPLTNRAVRYQPDAFESVQPITVTHLVLLVRAGLPVNTTDDFLKLAGQRDASASLTYGTVGVGSLYHLITEYLGKVTNVPFTHVPYSGTAPVIQDLAGGQIDFSIMPFQASMLEMIKSGRFKAIAVLSKNKPAVLAHLPSISDTPALANFEYASYAGYYVKKGTPAAVKEALNKAIGHALEDKAVIAKLEADGRNVSARMSLEDAASAYAREIAKYKEMIRVTGYVQAG
jgi:tripartite-type tricarboxylate transporter receptor subunit TctC